MGPADTHAQALPAARMVETPLVVVDLPKRRGTPTASLTALIRHFRAAIRSHPCARLIGVFDNAAHARTLPDGHVDKDIIAARTVIFCCGLSIPTPECLAWRPRSLGIAELEDRFVVSFIAPPMPLANSAIERWVAALLPQGVRPSVADRQENTVD